MTFSLALAQLGAFPELVSLHLGGEVRSGLVACSAINLTGAGFPLPDS
jgi:hypothetical protein